MSTPLNDIVDIINIFKNKDSVFADEVIPYKYAKWGVITASIPLNTDFVISLELDELENIIGGSIEPSLTDKQILLCGIYAYRIFAFQQHEMYATKAVNFKTINFAVSGLTERAKEMMRIVWWCDNEIERILNELLSSPMGNAEEMIYGYGE